MAVGRDSTVTGRLSPKRTVLRVSVARSAKRVRKLWRGSPSSVCRVRALARAAGETWAAATGEVVDAAAADRSWSSNSSGASVRRMCHGEHAEEDMGPHPAGQPMVDGADVEVDRLERPKGARDPG